MAFFQRQACTIFSHEIGPVLTLPNRFSIRTMIALYVVLTSIGYHRGARSQVKTPKVFKFRSLNQSLFHLGTIHILRGWVG